LSELAFVTGGTGFVGANLVRFLLSKGLRPRALVREGADLSNLRGLDVELIRGSLSDAKVLERGCTGAAYAFHVAADYRIWAPDPKPMYEANVQGTINFIEAAKAAGVKKIVCCSSVAAIKPPEGTTPADETSEYSSVDEIVSDYKKSKYLGEIEALKRGAIVVNPAAPIGPYDIKPTPTGRVVLDFLQGRIPSYIDTGLNVVHVEDVAQGHWLAALKGRPGERYILGSENLTLKQILDLLSDATGLPAPRFKTPYALAYAFGAVDTALARLGGWEPRAPLEAVKMARHYMWYSSDKARRELGYAPRPARLALADAAQYFKGREAVAA
jgi:dihydroflavonol-4-reductase